MDLDNLPAFSVIKADAVEGMRSLPSESIDAVITDPPYCSGGLSETGRLRSKAQGVRASGSNAGRWFKGDNMGAGGLSYLLRLVAVESFRVIKPGGSLVVFCDWRLLPALSPAIESAGLLYRGLVVWDKGHMGLGKGFRPRHELAMHFSAGKLNAHARDVSNVISAKRVSAKTRRHPCEKPADLLREILRVTTPEGGIVVDPFCGTGSTGEAAVSIGRRFIGFDRDTSYATEATE